MLRYTRFSGCGVVLAIALHASSAFGQTINPLSTNSTTGLSQTFAQEGPGVFSLTVRGTGFTSSSVVTMTPLVGAAANLATTFSGDSTTLTAAVPASLLKA